MTLDLDYDDGQQALSDAIARFCSERCDDDAVRCAAGSVPIDLWRGLAELGVLAVATPEGDGGALELSAAMEALGRAVFPGPLASTVLGAQVLAGAERSLVVEGRAIVSAGAPPLMPWAPVADVFLAIDGERVVRAELRGDVEPLETLGGEPWGRVSLELGDELSGGARALVLSEIAQAAYLAAAGARLLEDACEHARTRMQFGRAIGEFQAVAHPLADCSMRLAAAASLVRAAAFAFDCERGARLAVPAEPRTLAAGARFSAGRAALEAAHVAHQVFGAVGIALEGPVFHVSRRIRQLASHPPGRAWAEDALFAGLGEGREASA